MRPEMLVIFRNFNKFGLELGKCLPSWCRLSEIMAINANGPKRYRNMSSSKCNILEMNKFCGYFWWKLLVRTEILVIFRNFNKFGLEMGQRMPSWCRLMEIMEINANGPKRYGNIFSFKCNILQMNTFCGYFWRKL